jgi:hypothetical protein
VLSDIHPVTQLLPLEKALLIDAKELARCAVEEQHPFITKWWQKIVQAKAAPLEVGKPYRPHPQTPTPQNVLWWEMRQGLPSEIRDFYDAQSQGAISVLIG